MKTRDIAAELDRAFAAAKVKALTGDTIDPLHAIHKALKAKHAAGELTDKRFADKACELLELLRSAVNAAWRAEPRRQ
jgi:peptide subunit release factor 1 (eRF1)